MFLSDKKLRIITGICAILTVIALIVCVLLFINSDSVINYQIVRISDNRVFIALGLFFIFAISTYVSYNFITKGSDIYYSQIKPYWTFNRNYWKNIIDKKDGYIKTSH